MRPLGASREPPMRLFSSVLAYSLSFRWAAMHLIAFGSFSITKRFTGSAFVRAEMQMRLIYRSRHGSRHVVRRRWRAPSICCMHEHRGRGKTKIGRKSAAAQGTKALRDRKRANGGDGKGGKRAYSLSSLFCTQTRTTTELNKMYVIAPLILFSFSLHIIKLRQCLCARP